MKPVTVLAISGSPRRGGNSDALLDEAVKGAMSLGASVEKVFLCDYAVTACTECYQCSETGRCAIEDDFQHFYLKFLAVDRIILATPVFFMAPGAQTKALVDRCQCLWIRKYRLKQRIVPRDGIARRGYLVASAGSGLADSFDCPRKVATYFYRTIDMEFAGDVCVNGLNNVGDVEKRRDELRLAFELGMAAANPA